MTDTTSPIPDTLESALDRAMDALAASAPEFGAMRPAERAHVLRRIADALDANADDLVALAMAESHLPEGRCRSELGRTTFQLRFFADAIEEGSYLEATVDSADPDWGMGPRPDLRRMLRPIGPVVVFGASNFPFAFSTAGGDTAAALAAGCPVLVKAHPGHPHLTRRTGELVAEGIANAGIPDDWDVFAVVYGDNAAQQAVRHPHTRAVAFTGSVRGGRALHDIAVSRPDPIPFYGELGSINPVFVARSAAADRGQEILSGYVDSFTLGAGQFCTKPGVLMVPEETDLDALTRDVRGRPEAPLLNERVAGGFEERLGELANHPATELLARGTATPDGWTPTLLWTDAESLLTHRDTLLEECFGPASLVVGYREEERLLEIAGALQGQLTATVHAEEDEPVVPTLLDVLAHKAGRVLWNGWPTGVAVTHAMHHGGPYPATTSVLHTSVGSTSIRRFLRPVSYQSVPDALLPEALRDGNPLGLPRRVNGRLTV